MTEKRVGRRRFLAIGGTIAAGGIIGGASVAGGILPERGSSASAAAEPSQEALTAKQALERLLQGNKRFIRNKAKHPDQDARRRTELLSGQHPFATIISCSDSRVPPELIFDQGIGSLFIVRTAGHVIDRAALGSIQYGVHELHTPIVMVLGHSSCGAVKATIEAIEKGTKPTKTDIDYLVSSITPSVMKAKKIAPNDVLKTSIRENTNAAIATLTHSPLVSEAVAQKTTTVLGAHYDLASGKVEVFN